MKNALLKAHYKLDLGFTYADLEENNIPAGTQVYVKIPILKDDDIYDKSPAGR